MTNPSRTLARAARFLTLLCAPLALLCTRPCFAQTLWTQSYPGRPVHELNAVLWNGTAYIAAGEAGYVYHSATGATWTRYSTGQTSTLSGLAKSGTLYVAVGASGLATTSADGIAWTTRATGVTNSLTKVIWSGSLFVGVGSGGRVIRSADGITWSTGTAGSSTLNSVIFSGGQYVAANASGGIYTSPDATTWTLRTSGTSNAVTGIAHSGSRFVAVASGGVITTSADGAAWALASSVPFANYTGVIWTGSEFLAIADYGRTATSPDGLAWTANPLRDDWVFEPLRAAATSPAGEIIVGYDGAVFTRASGHPWVKTSSRRQPDLDSIAASASLRVAVGEGGAIVTSADDSVWTKQTSGTGVRLRDVTQLGSLWIAIGDAGTILTSPDGLAWTPRSSGVSVNLYAVTASGSIAVAAGRAGTLLVSSDGMVWTAATSGTSEHLRCAAWSGSDFIVGGVNVILRSLDGLSWNTVYSVSGRVWNSATWAGTRWWVVGDAARAVHSTNGTTWTTFSGIFTEDMYGLAWSGSLLQAAGLDELWGSSNFSSWSRYGMLRNRYVLHGAALGTRPYFVGEDGMIFSWSNPVGLLRPLDRSSWTHLQWDGTEIIAAGLEGKIGRTTSALGSGWSTHAVPTFNDLKATATGAGVRVAVGTLGTIATSNDGAHWISQSPVSSADLAAVAFSGTRFVAVGASGTIITSNNGVTWSAQSSGTAAALNSILWTGSQFVVAGAAGTVLTSPDGLSWHPRYTGLSSTLRGVAKSSGTIVITGDAGVVLSSTSGVVWRSETSGTTSALLGTVWAGDRFVAGAGSDARTSTDGATWSSATALLPTAITGLAWTGSRLVSGNALGEILVSTPSALPAAPQLTLQPENDVVVSGATATLQTAAAGAGITYQWYRGTAPDVTNPVGGATGTSFTTPPLTATTSYWVRATNGSGSASSRTATVTVGTAYDAWAYDHGLSSSISAGTADPDGDGNNNQTEFADGTDPYLASSILPRLTLNMLGGGTAEATPNQPTYSYNQVVTLTATPTAPNIFYGWGGDASGSASPLNLTLDKTKSVTANFGPVLGAAVEAAALSWTSGGSALWFPQTATTHDGVDALQCGDIADSQESWVQTTVTGPGLLAFWWKAGTETTNDKLEFILNGVSQTSISGDTAWASRSFTLAAGTHTLRWRYSKNASVSSNGDTVWLDEVTFTPFQSYTSWAAGEGLTGADAVAAADLDLDGLTNLTEFCLKNPPRDGRLTSPPFTESAGGAIRFRFFRNLSVSEVTWTVQWRTTAGTWSTAATKTTTGNWSASAGFAVAESPFTGEVIVTGPLVTANPQYFMRLRMVLP